MVPAVMLGMFLGAPERARALWALGDLVGSGPGGMRALLPDWWMVLGGTERSGVWWLGWCW